MLRLTELGARALQTEIAAPSLCAITRTEILYGARSAADFATLQDDLGAHRDLRIDHATLTSAESAQRELADRGQHRVSLPDLLIGA